MNAPSSLYVHAPFCARRCLYCDFAVTVDRSPGHDAWIEALAREWALLEEEGGWIPEGRLRTVYVGGGTPSLLGPGAMAALGEVVGRDRLADPALEWTAEANPESFTPEVASGWRRAGVTRVSLGAQTFDPAALRWMGRLHGTEGPGRAVAAARAVGFVSISLDLIFGLPERLGRRLDADIDALLALAPPHLSLYGLTAEPGTPLGRKVDSGAESLPDEERYAEEYLYIVGRLTAEGYEHYEVSNFARPGHASVHNRACWAGEAYLGLGNAAHSYRHPVRRWNIRDWAAYSTAVRGGRLPVEGAEGIGPEAERLERLWLSLRTREGIPVESLPPVGIDIATRWCRKGMAEMDGETLRLGASGWLVMDRLVVELDEAIAEAAGTRTAGRIQ